MKALVVYESYFGNTQRIARAIGEGLSGQLATTVVEVDAAPRTIPGDVTLLVLGGPTHAFSMSRPGTRQSARDQAPGPVASRGIGMREWLELIGSAGSVAPVVATFDTKVKRPNLPGSAASAARRRLAKAGFQALERPRTFWVDGMQGPLLEGEEAAAREWGARLATDVAGVVPRP